MAQYRTTGLIQNYWQRRYTRLLDKTLRRRDELEGKTEEQTEQIRLRWAIEDGAEKVSDAISDSSLARSFGGSRGFFF